MTLRETIQMLSESLTDIPANPSHVYYTNYEDLYKVLKNGLSGQREPILVIRNTSKDTPARIFEKSNNNKFYDYVKINLFTDRIKSGVRGAAFFPAAPEASTWTVLRKFANSMFEDKYGLKLPKDIFSGEDFNKEALFKFMNANPQVFDNKEKQDEAWQGLQRLLNAKKNEYWKLTERDSKEVLISSQAVPVNPKFMEIVIEKNPREMDIDFLHRLKKDDGLRRSFLKLIERHEAAFEDNKNFKALKAMLQNDL